MTLTAYDLEAYRIHFQSQGKPKELLGHRSKVQTLAWSLEGDKLASGSSDGCIRIWSLEKIASAFANNASSKSNSREISQTLSIELANGKHSKTVNQLQWCPFDSNILASCSTDKTIEIWNISAAEQSINALTIQVEAEILTLSWHPKQPILSVGTKDDKILIYKLNQLDSTNLVETLKFGSEVNEVAWSPDGKDLSVALGFGEVDIYDCDSWTRRQSLKAHTADCFCVKYFSDESACMPLLAVGSSDSQVSIWKRSASSDFKYNCMRVFNRMEWPIRTISFSHDGEFLAVGSEDPFIAVEHVRTGSLVAKISTGKSSSDSRAGIPINSVAWHPKNNILAFAGSEVDDRTGRATGAIKLFGI